MILLALLVAGILVGAGAAYLRKGDDYFIDSARLIQVLKDEKRRGPK